MRLRGSLILGIGLLPFAAAGRHPATDRPLDPRRRDLDSMVSRFYQDRGGRLAWLDSTGPAPAAHQLAAALASAGNDGLDPAFYRAAELADALHDRENLKDRQALDSALTRGFLEYARDLADGRVIPKAVNAQWQGSPETLDLVALMETALRSGDIAGGIDLARPAHPGYRALRGMLARYRQIAREGGWARLPAGETIRVNQVDPRVPLLRNRLAREGFPAVPGENPDLYEGELEEAVRRYQASRGLAADGAVGPATIASLNVSPEARARQIAVNLERWRWLPAHISRPSVIVNAAGFTLDFLDAEGRDWRTRIIVGRKTWTTPTVSSEITGIVFGPRWTIPSSIARREILPAIKRRPRFLADEGIRVYDGGRLVDPSVVDWGSVTAARLRYRFVQEPGPKNPLGQVKFVIRTPYGVYLHDTPSQALFDLDQRQLSHGCVRVRSVDTLAAYLLPAWPRDSILAAMRESRNRTVTLERPVPVHLVYWTAWVDSAGAMQFRPDGYRWDDQLAAALGGP